MQGYLFGAPMIAADFVAVLARDQHEAELRQA
jgi:hypothetical protein